MWEISRFQFQVLLFFCDRKYRPREQYYRSTSTTGHASSTTAGYFRGYFRYYFRLSFSVLDTLVFNQSTSTTGPFPSTTGPPVLPAHLPVLPVLRVLSCCQVLQRPDFVKGFKYPFTYLWMASFCTLSLLHCCTS